MRKIEYTIREVARFELTKTVSHNDGNGAGVSSEVVGVFSSEECANDVADALGAKESI